MKTYDIVIIGGGLAGLTSANLLSRAGFEVALIEKRRYPFHKVCGEYLSREVVPFMADLGVDLNDPEYSQIDEFEMSAPSGNKFQMPLDLGGVGISRHRLDHTLYELARDNGTTFIFDEVKNIERTNHFTVYLKSGKLVFGRMAIGAYGKLSRIDAELSRPYWKKSRPFMAVKYHVRIDLPSNRVSLHNFKGGYLGINGIENGKHNLCYLVRREVVTAAGSIKAAEEKVLSKNPFIREVFKNAVQLWEKPLAINSFRFETKEPAVKNIMMCGDTSGLIVPLTGNGMALAIHQAKILSEIIIDKGVDDKESTATEYSLKWNRLFRRRYNFSNRVQGLFGNNASSSFGVWMGSNMQFIARSIMKKTHGSPF